MTRPSLPAETQVLEESMLTKILKCAAMAALLGQFFAGPFAGYATVLQFVVSAAAVAVLVQAAGVRRYLWMSAFILAACLFNPILPVGFSGQISNVVSALTLILFFLSLQLLHSSPRLSVVSITDRMPESESL
jgi:hypothetical protein